MKYALADLTNGVLEVFDTYEEAFKARLEAVEEGIRLEFDGTEDGILPMTRLHEIKDFYRVVEVSSDGIIL